MWNHGNPAIINNLIINNSCSGFNGGRGGGIYLDHSDTKIVNNTIAYNHTTGDEYGDGFGGGICIGDWALPVIKNGIIWYNQSGASSMNIYFDPHEWLDISYGNVQEDLGHIFDLKPYTNMDVPPEFVDPENEDFQLGWNSPCINRGQPDTTGLYLPLVDLMGHIRVFGDTVEIGAFEFSGPTVTRLPSASKDFRLYPNPGSGLLYLECREGLREDEWLMRIFNVNGKLVFEKVAEPTESTVLLDFSKEADGIYFLTVHSKGQLRYRKKMIKE